jgi:SSS family solute:Na+ symporter
LTIHFGIFDYLIIVFYFLGVLYVGFRTKSTDQSNLEYLVAGRRLTLPAFVATLVSTFYGGVLGIGEFTYYFGISSWFLYAFPYYFFITIFAIFLAKRIRRARLYTIPDKLEMTYGKNVSVLGAVFVFLLVTPAPYIFMLGILTQLIFGWSLLVSMVVVLIFSVVYLFKGGLIADIRVNVFEFILMFTGFGIILPFCFFKLGGLDFLVNNLPSTHLDLTGGNSLQYILVWFFIGAWALVDPSFHQRCYAAKSESTARNGIFVSLIFWFVFDFLTTTCGLYAAAHLKGLNNPAMSYPLLANDILPTFAKGFFFVGMIATIMSTLHSYIFISATTLGKDIYCKIKNISDEKNSSTKYGIIITSIISVLIVILIPSVVEIWYTIGSLIIPALIISVVSSYSDKLTINKGWIFSAMFISFIVSFTSFLYGNFNKFEGQSYYIFNIEPIYPGMFSGLIIYFIGLVFKHRLIHNLNSE